MRVLMVIAPVPGTELPPIWARRQIDSLSALGVTVETYVFHNRKSLVGLMRGGLGIRRRAREFDADLVHIHFGASQALAGVLCAGKPVVLSFCGSDLLGNYTAKGKKTWSGRLSGVLSRLAAFGCPRTIAKSGELRDTLWLRSLRAKCHVIPNGVDLSLFTPMVQANARARLGWAHREPVVLFMDRKGAWVKDPQLAHATVEEARKAIPSLRLHVIEQEPPDAMPLYFNAADVLLLTSRHEGSNNTVKEALACNLPVVATSCGDVPERLAGVQWSFVGPRDAHALGQLLTQVVAARQRSNGRANVQELTIARVAQQIHHVYEAVLSDSRNLNALAVGYK